MQSHEGCNGFAVSLFVNIWVSHGVKTEPGERLRGRRFHKPGAQNLTSLHLKQRAAQKIICT
jgi:hypothetical protein